MKSNHVHESSNCPCQWTGKVTVDSSGVMKTGSLRLEHPQQKLGKPLPKLANTKGT